MLKQLTLCKCKFRKELYHVNDHEDKWMKRSAETPEQCEMQLKNNHE
jgi:hypothetical protein